MLKPTRRKRRKRRAPPVPYWQTRDKETVTLYQGDVLAVLRGLPSESVNCVVTSPPYWGLRDYGTEGQLGSEPTPEEFVENMVNVFREVRRVLRSDGTLWLNLGDTYSGGSGGRATNSGKQKSNNGTMIAPRPGLEGVPSGNLVGVPWRVALALQADGWVLRQDIIWHKPSPMPESVRNRCTKAHEYIFLLTKKGSGYWYDAEAVREDASEGRRMPTESGDGFRSKKYQNHNARNNSNQLTSNMGVAGYDREAGRNKRSVWTIASESYPGAHFATFPRKLISPCILAGCPPKVCADCGEPWARVTEREAPERGAKLERHKDSPHRQEGLVNKDGSRNASFSFKTLGWEPSCDCESETEPTPGVVLDPFIGSGTSCVVSLANGRKSIGIDLSEDYLQKNAIPRIEGAILDRPEIAGLVREAPKPMEGGMF